MAHVKIEYPEEYEIEPVELKSTSAAEVAIFMANNLRNWCVDSTVSIVIDGKEY